MRANLQVLRVLLFARILMLPASGFFIGSPPAFSQKTDKTSAAAAEKKPPFQLKVNSNLVVMRVVVRDAEGKPVAGLQKEDFQVLDRGKEQSITQFDVETASPSPSTSTSAPIAGQAGQSPAPGAPDNFLALYFDDLDTTDADMIYVRNAADRFLAANLQPKDRVAIFNSAKMLSDFTTDPKQIHDALAKLRTSGRSTMRIHDCPDLSDYQALQITEQENPAYSDAWQKALEEAVTRCHMGGGGGQASEADVPQQGASSSTPLGDSPLAITIRSMARNIVFQADIQARSNLLELERVVDYLSQMPGRRTLILVSPGFLSESEQFSLDRLIDHALRSQVVISSLDPRGLALMVSGDVSQQYIFGHPGTAERLETQRELVATSVLADIAQSTGGEFFHNNNDLKAGFGALAGSPVYYLLGFVPSALKEDGGFHALKVKLAESKKGFNVQTRRGYFAPKNEAEAEAEAKREAASEIEAQSQEQIREAMFAKTDSQQFQVGLGGKLSEAPGGMRELSIFTHLDAKPLHFQKEGNHNLNTVTFVFAVFDQKDDLVMAQQRVAHLSLLDGDLPGLFKDGVNASAKLDLKPGIYRIREVVTDSVDHHLTTHSTAIKIP
jgi:VWFA-related protein